MVPHPHGNIPSIQPLGEIDGGAAGVRKTDNTQVVLRATQQLQLGNLRQLFVQVPLQMLLVPRHGFTVLSTEKFETGAKACDSRQRRSTRLKAMGQFRIVTGKQIHIGDHLATALPGGHSFQPLLAPEYQANSARAVKFMRRAHKKITPDRRNINPVVGRQLRAVQNPENIPIRQLGTQGTQIGAETKGVGAGSDRDDFSARRQHLMEAINLGDPLLIGHKAQP